MQQHFNSESTDNMADGCKDERFSVTNMSELFQKCAKSKHAEEVDMDSYLDAWGELIRFVCTALICFLKLIFLLMVSGHVLTLTLQHY